MKIYIIGYGKAGSAFASELNDCGFEIAFVTDRNHSNLKIAKDVIPSVKTSSMVEKEFTSQAGAVIVSVQDDKLTSAVSEITGQGTDLRNKLFFHTSGSQSSDVFVDAGIEKENSASFHPIQTFSQVSTENSGLLKRIYFGIEGGDNAVELAKSITAALGSDYLIIPKEKKHLYHTTCVVASNFLVTLMNVAAEFSMSAGIEKDKMFDVFRPIIQKTISNISEQGLTDSLTGPFERNDIETIQNHLNSIKGELPELIPFYTLLGMETVRVAFRKESLSMNNVISILDLMNKYVNEEKKITDTISKE